MLSSAFRFSFQQELLAGFGLGPNLRYLILRFFVYSGLIFLGFALFRTQVLQGGHYRKLSEKNRIRLQPANETMDPIYTTAENLEIKGRVVGVLRTVD